MSKKTASAPEKWSIENGLSIFDVAALEAQCPWLQSLPRDKQLRLRLVGIEEVDSAGVQWLLALKHRLKLHGNELVLDAEASPELSEALLLMGLTESLGIAVVAEEDA